MNFFDLCIKRPVLATVLSLVVVLLGLIGYQRLSIREYPKIDEPIVSVSTTTTNDSTVARTGRLMQRSKKFIRLLPVSAI